MNKKLAPNQIDSKISESVREEKSFDPDPLWKLKAWIRIHYESWRPGSESITVNCVHLINQLGSYNDRKTAKLNIRLVR